MTSYLPSVCGHISNGAHGDNTHHLDHYASHSILPSNHPCANHPTLSTPTHPSTPTPYLYNPLDPFSSPHLLTPCVSDWQCINEH